MFSLSPEPNPSTDPDPGAEHQPGAGLGSAHRGALSDEHGAPRRAGGRGGVRR